MFALLPLQVVDSAGFICNSELHGEAEARAIHSVAIVYTRMLYIATVYVFIHEFLELFNAMIAPLVVPATIAE